MSEPSAGTRYGRHSVRYRLLAIALWPTLVILPLFIGALIYWWNARLDTLLTSKVGSDLKIADQYMSQLLLDNRDAVSALGESARFQQALVRAPQDSTALAALLASQARERGLDFLYVVDAAGTVTSSAQPLADAAVRTDWPVVRTALGGTARVAVDVFDGPQLAAVSRELAERARIQPMASRTPFQASAKEGRGLVVHSAAPLTLPDGHPGALVAGILLNRNLRFVDSIRRLIYRDPTVHESASGTVSLFLDDVRISTNVRMSAGARALGTRASSEVGKAVLGEGRTWLDDAYVVNDWHVSGYEPITDSGGRRVGMLYVGFSERPYAEAKRFTLAVVVIAFLMVAGITVPLFLYWARNIFRPLERMAETIGRVERGDLDARTGPVDARDEVGQVSAHLDNLLRQLQASHAQLRQWNDELNERVEERTRNLLAANQQLEETTRQLVMSEKLATIGEITAGVAHEINNPLAVMQGNLEVVRDLMGSRAEQADVEFRLLDEQIHRIGTIVTKLLQFSKPSEYAGYLEQQDVSEIVSDTLPLVQHLLKKTAIVVERQFNATRLVSVNKPELQQVLVNLIINAIHAMPDGGRLVLGTKDAGSSGGQAGVAVQVADDGMGIPAELVSRIFDPFFTTKQVGGTGLGLSISQMLVSRQGGQLSAASEAGQGTTFTVWLPASG